MDIFNVLASALASITLAGIIYLYSKVLIKYPNLLYSKTRKEHEVNEDVPSYQERIKDATDLLLTASGNVDQVLNELTVIAREKEITISQLENQLNKLSNRELALKKRVENLEKIPLPALQYFESLLKKGEKRSASRDYKLFALGVIVTSIIGTVFMIVGG